jgi:hypothetical protein
MPSRYDNATQISNVKKTLPNGEIKRVTRLATVNYPTFPNQRDVYVIAQQGDRLDHLAMEYFGDESYWWVIARVNNLGKGTLVIPPGTTLKIPYYDDLSGIAALFAMMDDSVYTENVFGSMR